MGREERWEGGWKGVRKHIYDSESVKSGFHGHAAK